jgi:hypothetical protein
LTRSDPGFAGDLRGFLSQTYNLKSIADYETGPDAEVSAQQATNALHVARQFVSYFESLLSTP